jgi:hypothetical protein
LLAFREAVLIATEVAEPLVRNLDAAARERLDDGDDSDDRLYRGLPTVVVRKRALGKYDEGVLQRRSDVLQGIGAQFLAGELPAFEGGGLDELKEERDGSTDESPPDGEPT